MSKPGPTAKPFELRALESGAGGRSHRPIDITGVFRPEVTRPLGCKVPVLAWADCAIPYTAGKGAVLVQESKDFVEIAGVLNEIISRPEIREKVIAAQLEQIRTNREFPFEETLLDALEDLKKTQPVLLKEVLSGKGTG